MRKPVALDLFAGCGGLTLGLKQAGFHVIGAVEINPIAVSTYTENHREVLVWQKDICLLPATEVMRKLHLKRGELDLLAGCPPCQGFSAIRTLNGKYVVNDEQNDLIFEFMRFVRNLRPRAIMLENVPAILKDRRIGVMLEQLQGLGYKCSMDVLNAADYGVPQRRRRFILLAGRHSTIRFGKAARSKPVVRDALAKLGKRSMRDPLHNYKERRSEEVRRRIKGIPKDGGSRKDLQNTDQLDCHKKCNGFNDIYGRMRWSDVAPTITTGFYNPSKGRFLHPSRNRAITLREASLLQSFPKSYFFSLARGRTAVAEMIGNALPPEFIRRHAIAVAEHLDFLAHRKDK